MSKLLISAAFCLSILTFNANADLYPGLGEYPNNSIITINDMKNLDFGGEKSNLSEALALQTPVKSQGRRGTCSIFSAVALLESKLISEMDYENTIDLSEEWAQFLAMKGKTSDGYWSYRNWYNVANYGIVSEDSWPYDPSIWNEDSLTQAQQKRCGHLIDSKFKSCLLGHRDHDLLTASAEALLNEENPFFDPEFIELKHEAELSKLDWVGSLYNGGYSWSSAYQVYSVSEVRENLKNNNFMTLSIPFFYGAWNHGKAEKLGIGKSLENWKLGIVGFPEPGSKDFKISREKENKAGHSVLVIGYDDDVVIKTRQRMEDGSEKEFEYKGAYIFKNSWGNNSFGVNSVVEPGYGMISAKYVHKYGSFYQLR